MSEAERTSPASTAIALAAELGFGADTFEVLAGGNQNHVVRLHSRSSDVVLRYARDTNRLTMDPFDVEQWCSRAAAAVGIATPPTLARAHVGGHSVIVQEFVPGVPAEAGDLQAWAAIGRFAAALQNIDTADAPVGLFSRFGRDLDAAWLAHIDDNLDALTPADPVQDLGVTSRSSKPRCVSCSPTYAIARCRRACVTATSRHAISSRTPRAVTSSSTGVRPPWVQCPGPISS